VKRLLPTACGLALAAFAAGAIAEGTEPGATPQPQPAPAAAEARVPGTGDISPAQRAVFMNHMQNTTPGTTIEYRFTHRGSLDQPFDDTVKLIMLPADAAPGRDGAPPAAVAFLTGARQTRVNPSGDPTGNPVVLYFLERDSREMERLTGGKAPYHQRRIKIALNEDQTVEPIEIDWDGRKVAARRVTITPYRDFAHEDLKAKYGPLLAKRYEIVLSDAIPGTLYSMRAFVPDGDKPVVDDMLVFAGVKQGATAPAGATREPAAQPAGSPK
jgi:hypothetical protein